MHCDLKDRLMDFRRFVLLQYVYDFSFLQISLEHVKALKAKGEDYIPLFGLNVSVCVCACVCVLIASVCECIPVIYLSKICFCLAVVFPGVDGVNVLRCVRRYHFTALG